MEAGLDPAKPHKLSEVLETIKPPEPDKNSSIREKKVFEEWRKLKIQNDEKSGVLVPRADVSQVLSVVIQKACEILDNRIPNEAVPRLVDQEDVARVRAGLKREIDAAKREIQEAGKLLASL